MVDNDKKFEDFLKNIEDGYYEVDLKGNFTLVNDALCRLFGFTKDKLIGVGNRDYTDQSNAKMLLKKFNNVFRTGKPSRGFEFEVLDKKGKIRHAEGSASLVRREDGEPIGFRGIIRDISRRKIIEHALKESEEKYRLVVENATEGILISQYNRIKYTNPRLLGVLGYKKEEVLEKDFLGFLHPGDQKRVSDVCSRLLNGEKLSAPLSFRAFTKDHRERMIQTKAVLIKWETGPALLVFLRDITSQTLLESQLQQAHKLEAIGTLAGGIAHDFNNILGSIVLNAELALDDVKKNTEAAYSIEQVLSASRRARDLVDQILTFSRNADVERNPIKINSIVKETIKMLRAMLPSTIVIKSFIDPEIYLMLANPTQIQQLVINLCTNAAHAMSEKGGILDLLVDNHLVEKKISGQGELEPGLYVRLVIVDSGYGMEPEFKERIFEPFFTTKRIGEGTGLGLSVVHGIVASHEGKIIVESTPGMGSTFKVYFPAITGGAVSTGEQGGKTVPMGDAEILFADDEPILLDAGERMLSRIGCRVTLAVDGAEAFSLFKNDPEKYDLIITDMTMPFMTGLELASKVQKIRPGFPIILCTGYNENITPEKAKALGIYKYLMKPYSLIEIAEAIQMIVKEKRTVEAEDGDQGALLREKKP